MVASRDPENNPVPLIKPQARTTFPAKKAAFVIHFVSASQVNLAAFTAFPPTASSSNLMTSTPRQSSTSRSRPVSSAQTPNLANGSNLASQGRTSLPSATNPSSAKPNASEPNKMSAAVGGAPPAHGHSESVNGRNPTIPAIPSVNGNVSLPDHTRKTSTTVTPAGASAFPPNGTVPTGPQTKPGVTFGSFGNPSSSPAMGTPSLAHQNTSNLGVSQLNPRDSAASNSPSPIPQPSHLVGGRPPTSITGSSNGYTFGDMPVVPRDSGDQVSRRKKKY